MDASWRLAEAPNGAVELGGPAPSLVYAAYGSRQIYASWHNFMAFAPFSSTGTPAPALEERELSCIISPTLKGVLYGTWLPRDHLGGDLSMF